MLLAINEEDWVYRVLKDFARPLETKKIAKEIANRFVISPKYLLETNFINPDDKRLIKLSDGLWGLNDWVEEWEKELGKVEVLLKKIFEQKETLERIRLEKESKNEKLSLLEEMRIKYSQDINLLETEIGMIKGELQKTSAEMSKKNTEFSEVNHEIDGLKMQINSLDYKNKIVFTVLHHHFTIFSNIFYWNLYMVF